MNKPSKNKPCPCGKGKLYKRCCGMEKFDFRLLDNGNLKLEKVDNQIIYTNLLTTKEKQQLLQKIKINRPQLEIEIKAKVEKVVQLINSFDKKFVLSMISLKFYGKIMANSIDDAASEIALEYCQSICMATNNHNSGVIPDAKSINEIHNTLLEIRQLFNFYYRSEDNQQKFTKIESDFRKKMIAETMLIRGSGYSVHIKTLFKKMFGAHDEYLVKNFGFKATDIIDTLEMVDREINNRLRRPGKVIDIFEIDCSRLEFEQKKVFESLSLAFGENEDILLKGKPGNEYFYLNDSPVFKNPFVTEDNKFYVFSPHLCERHLFEIGMELMKKDCSYFKNKFEGTKLDISKDKFIESQVLELFNQMLPNVKFYPNATYSYFEKDLALKCATTGATEIDIVGISNSATYLIEVKAGLVGKDSKRGAVKSIKTDLTNIIGDAVCQSYRAHRHIENSSTPEFTCNGHTIVPLNTKKVFRICVSFSYVGKIISSFLKLKELNVIEKNAGFAWILNILDLYVFSDLIQSESMFIDYLEKRTKLYHDKRIEGLDEIAVLGFYFHDDMKFNKIHDKVIGVKINPHYTQEIDEYYQKGGTKPTKKP